MKIGREDDIALEEGMSSPRGTPSHTDLTAGLGLPRNTLRHVHKVARALWAEALSAALSEFTSAPSVSSATSLVVLPRIVLAPGGRGGRKHSRQFGDIVATRLRRWLLGQRARSPVGSSQERNST